jgi:non-specific serine/threonine protein kinase
MNRDQGNTADATSAPAAAVPTWQVLDLLTGLVDKSLVFCDTDETGGVRYRLLETVRQYCAERLRERGEAARFRDRHRDYFLALADAFAEDPSIAGLARGIDEGFGRLETEHDNLRAALRWCLDDAPDAALAGLRLAGKLWGLWLIRGHLTEGRTWLGEVLERSSGDDPAAESAVLRARALSAAGFLAYFQGDYARTVAACRESVTLFRGTDDASGGIAFPLALLGFAAHAAGDVEQAAAHGEEALAAARRAGNGWLMHLALQTLGTAAAQRGDPERAVALLQEALGLARAARDGVGAAFCLFRLGDVEAGRERRGPARAYFRQSLVLFRDVGVRPGIPYALEAFAALAAGGGEGERAARLLGAAEAQREVIGVPVDASFHRDYDRTVAAARDALGEPAFAAARAAGRALSREAAVAEALAEEGGAEPG